MAITDPVVPGVDDEAFSPLERSRVDRHIDRIVAAAPRLTDEQAARLRALFAPVAQTSD